MKASTRAWVAARGPTAVLITVVAVFVLLQGARPDPFATSNDNTGYFLPLTSAIVDAWRHGTPLRVLWSLGAGWTPWLSGQSGVLSPGLVLADLIRGPLNLTLLDASALLSMLATAIVALTLLPRWIAGPQRSLAAAALALVPAPILMGLKWHDYLAPAPAFLACALLLWRVMDDRRGRAAPVIGLVAASALCFTAGHAQMVAIGVGFLGLFALASARSLRAAVRGLAWLAFAQLPLLLPMLVIKLQASAMAGAYARSHRGKSLFLLRAVEPGDVLAGTALGDLAPAVARHAEGLGVFFSPLLFFVLAFALLTRRWWTLPFVVLSIALLAPTLVPGTDLLAVGPLAGFRWTMKLTVLIVPLTVALALRLARTHRRAWRMLVIALVPLVIAEAAVIVRGASSASLKSAHHIGARAVLDAARACIDEIGIRPGTRIAIAGKFEHKTLDAPPALTGIANDTAILVGLESAHLYDPLDPKDRSSEHLGLAALWKTTIAPDALRAPDAARTLRDLRDIGVESVVAADRAALGELAADARSCSGGVWAAAVPDAVGVRWPWQITPDGPRPLEREVDGTLVTQAREPAPPRVSTTWPIAWTQQIDGRWRGVPDLGFSGVLGGSAIVFALVCALALQHARVQRSSARTRAPARLSRSSTKEREVAAAPVPATPNPRAALSLVGAIPLTLLVLTVAECLQLPWQIVRHAPVHAVNLLWLVLGSAAWLFAPVIGAIVVLAALLAAPTVRALSVSRRVGVTAALACTSAALGHHALINDPKLAWYPPLLAFHLGLAVALTLSYLRLDAQMFASVARPLRAVSVRQAAVLSLLASAGIFAANLRLHADDYAPLHLAALMASAALLHAGLSLLLLDRMRAVVARRAIALVIAINAACVPLALVARGTTLGQAARPYLLSFTTVGRSLALELPRKADVAPSRPAPPPDVASWFSAHSGMPALPEAFALGGFNVLLVVSEALRFDQTSLRGAAGEMPALDTTPHLAALAADPHTMSFARAYAPASCTAQSMSSMMTMHLPAGQHFEVWKNRWHGRLFDDNDTVGELFSASGYATFSVTHNFLRFFGEGIIGLEQGFSEVKRVPASRTSVKTDKKIASAAIERLAAAAIAQERFFGWVFFVSPHSPYARHDKKRPAKTALERYHQELRYMDAQLGRVIAELKRSGLFENTIVIVMGDHGEQFGEHGGTGHSRNVYAESVWVPLLVRVPGVAGATIAKPVSTSYVFPWLLLHGDDALSAAATRALGDDIVPLMQATGDAVVVELVGADRARTALVTAEHKVNHDSITGLHEIYRIDQDPLEQRNLYEVDAALARQAEAQVRAYRATRAATRKLVIDPTRVRADSRR